MIPPWIWFVKNMLNSTISMSYPDVVIACIEHTSMFWKHSEQLRQRWWSTIIIWRIIPWWLTDHHNCQSFKLFSLWQSQHAVCHCQESGKTATQLLQCLVIKWIYNIVLFEEERGMFILHHFQLMYMLSFLTLVSDGRLQWPRLRNSGPFLLKSDVNLFNHLVRKVMLRVVVLRVSFFVDMRLPRVFSVADLYCLKLFLR